MTRHSLPLAAAMCIATVAVFIAAGAALGGWLFEQFHPKGP